MLGVNGPPHHQSCTPKFVNPTFSAAPVKHNMIDASRDGEDGVEGTGRDEAGQGGAGEPLGEWFKAAQKRY